ncbi:MAG: hypothetical protein ACFE8Z_05560, partial [Candidatus Hermodarchaeota archaeon]
MASEKNNRTGRGAAMRYMLGGLARHPGAIAFALTLTVISTLLVTIPSVIIGLAIDELELSGLGAQFTFLVWIIVLFGVAYLAMYFIVGYVWAIVTLRWERDSRQDFFEEL